MALTSRIPRIRCASAGPAAVLAMLLMTLAFPVTARAQEMGTLQGTVRDLEGAPIAAAAVEVELQGAAFQRGTTTDAAGRYRLTGLPAGRYRVRIRQLGYASVDAVVPVARGEAAGRDFVLRELAVVVDTVTVTGRNPAAIRRDDTEFSTEVSEAAIELLPLRPDVGEIVALTPGARAEQVWGGATAQANLYQIDGMAANHPGLGGGLLQPSLGWIESMEVRGLGAAAEFGNFQGGLVNVVTKRGTNRFEGAVRTGVEAGALSSSNLQAYDVAAEMDSRYDVEAEARGPILRDRLFYYVAGQLVRRQDLVVNHLTTRASFYAPDPVEARETKAFGKLAWHPSSRGQLTVSGGFTDARTDRFGATGYEDGAFVRASAPTYFVNGEYRHLLGGSVLELTAAGISRDERRVPLGGEELPGVLLFGAGERPAYNAAVFSQRLAPSSATAGASIGWEMRTGSLTHRFKAGGELSAGRWVQERLRNGGMTWRPGYGRFYEDFDPADTDTWVRNGFVPVAFGGEVRMDADVTNGAVYLQDQVDFGPRFSLSPGVRLGWWSGYITPYGDIGPRFRAVRDRAWDPRLGATLDLTGRNELVLKAHWGRYHQSLFAQFFDRALGGNVFQNEQLWYYHGRPDSPGETWNASQRDALALDGRLRLQEEVRLNQTGPVDGWRQPYVDQLVVGLERQLGRWWKAELVYVNRRNGDMAALVDRNRATNYSVWENIRVYDAAGNPIVFQGEEVVLPRLYLPNFMIVDHLKVIAGRGEQPGFELPPGMSVADTVGLDWNPDYVLTHAPEARRMFHQAQLVVRMGHPRHGGTASLVWTQLHGNLDNVSGYHESALFAGPYVNPNQAINDHGRLANTDELELKVWVYGALRWGFRGGLFWTQARGDRYAPIFNLSQFYHYRDAEGRPFSTRLMVPVSGQPVFLHPRGSREMPPRSLVDLHLERGVRIGGGEWMLTADAFNVLGTNTPTRYNTIVNGAIAPGSPLGGGVDPELVYGAVRERVRPRSLRLGAIVRF